MKKLANKKPAKKKPVKHLLQGMESKAMIDCLIAGTKINSERKIAALHEYFVKGRSLDESAELNDLPQPNLSAAIDTLNSIAGVCVRYHELKMHSKIYKDNNTS